MAELVCISREAAYPLTEPLMGHRPATVAGGEQGHGGISGISELTRLLSM